MATRTFTVYIDEPTSASVVPRKPVSRAPSRATTPLSPTSSFAGMPLPDKENTHPITGERATSLGPGSKGALKRKTGVLETKLYMPPKSKKTKDASEPVKPKRRGVSAPPVSAPLVSAPASPRKAKAKKAAPASGTAAAKARRTTARKASAKGMVPELAPVNEEQELPEEDIVLSQAGIDARCYDLTVLPLADVSEAYEADAEPMAGPSKKKAKKPRVQTVDTEIRDYFDESHTIAAPRKLCRSMSLPVGTFSTTQFNSTPLSAFPTASSSGFDFSDSFSTFASSSSSISSQATLVSPTEEWSEAKEVEEVLGQPAPFDTPERKRIYAAFTFTTPSPTNDRYRRARSTSVDRFGDIEFVPVA